MKETQAAEADLSVRDIFAVCLAHWRFFLTFAAIFLSGSFLLFTLRMPYVANAIVVFNDSQNSSLQAFSSQFYGLSKSVQESKKGSSLLSRQIEFLKNREFFEALMLEISRRGNSSKISFDERQGFEKFRGHYLNDFNSEEKKIELLQKLDHWIKVTLESDFQIKIAVSSPNRGISLFIANTMSELAINELMKRELQEISKIEAFISEQKGHADLNLKNLGAQIVGNQSLNDNLIPFASKDKIADYVADLFVRTNEIKMKIAENKYLINRLEQQRTGLNESALYGIAGRISSIKSEDEILEGKLGEVLLTVSRLKTVLKQLPYQTEISETLKKKSEIEYLRYRELSSALEKLEAAKFSIDTRFEVLEKARNENTLPLVSMASLAMISILLSQILGCFVVYFKFLWNPTYFRDVHSKGINEGFNNYFESDLRPLKSSDLDFMENQNTQEKQPEVSVS
jgi:hypothetical protein